MRRSGEEEQLIAVVSEYALKLSEPELARYRFMAESAARMEGELWAASAIVPGAVVADVGCGPGAVSAVLAALVGPIGRWWRSIGTPRPSRLLAPSWLRPGPTTSRSRLAKHDTGIAPGSVDVVMIRHVLGHNGALENAIVAHAATLVRPGGSVYLTEGYPEGRPGSTPSPIG